MPARWSAGVSRASLVRTAVLAAAFAAGIAVVGMSAPGVPLAAMAAGWALATAAAAVLVHRHASGLAAVSRSLRPGAAEDTGELARLAGGTGEVAEIAGALIRRLREDEADLVRARAETDGLRGVVAELPDPVLVIDPDDRISLANASAGRVFGATLHGRDLKTVLRDPDLLSALAAVREGGDSEDIEITEAGPVEPVYRVRVTPVEPDGACLLAFTSLTEARRAEQMRAEFVANVSHELRTPLAILHGFVETLRGPARDDAEARGRFLGIMHIQSSRMTQLVEDLLSLTRIEAREHHVPTDTVAIGRVIERTVAGVRYVADRKGMTIELAVRDALPEVVGDADELLQVTQNLVDNAIKYGRADSVVTVEAMMADDMEPSCRAEDRGMIAVAVHDQGEGIAREHIPRLTERFYRVDSARSRELGGTGLGLAIVKHIVARHRGSLAITSTVGAGSTFTVFLPTA